MYLFKLGYPMRFTTIFASLCFWALLNQTVTLDRVLAAGPADVDLAGTYMGAQGEMIRLKDPQGNIVGAIVDARGSVINYRGKVDRSALKPGTFIRFTAPATPEGNFLSPINEVELYMPKPEVLNRRASPQEMSRTHPGVYVMSIIAPAPAGQMSSPDVRVVGQIVSIAENAMDLQCGDRNLKLEIEPDMRVVINAPSLQWAMIGDSISGKGTFNASGQLVIRSLTVTGAKTLGTEQANATAQAPGTEKKMTAKEKAKAKKEAALAKKNKKNEVTPTKNETEEKQNEAQK